jgi:NADPH-dependent 2,4-dienoyl-CoA reductase/sulfur reductase-like enzyme
MEFVIIGGDAAGMSAASRAKRLRPDLKVTVLEKITDASYSACGMPYNIADPKRKIEDLREKQDIHLLTGHCAKAIDRINKTVIGTSLKGKNFEFSFDKLLIATGASPIMPDLPGFNLPGVLQLKTSMTEER